jgi:hypothetical protein
MSPQPHRNPAGKGEGESPPLPDQESPIDRFTELARRILQVPVADVHEAERRFAQERKGKNTKTDPGRLIPNPKNAT